MKRPFFSTPVRFLALGLAGLLCACSGPREYFALSSESGAPVGTMQIKSLEGSEPVAPFTLDARTPVALRDGAGTRAADLDAAQLRSKFMAALGAQPLPPTRFTLYFNEGGDTLSVESQAEVSAILEAIKQRPAPDLQVIGHTDRVGSVKDNDKLSGKRAESIRQQLMARGIDADNIQAFGRGEREPLVSTADEVAEPRNRRVEIMVR